MSGFWLVIRGRIGYSGFGFGRKWEYGLFEDNNIPGYENPPQ